MSLCAQAVAVMPGACCASPSLRRPVRASAQRPVCVHRPAPGALSGCGVAAGARFAPAARRGDVSVKAVELLDPWGVSAESWESIEANLFAVSLFPYLAFLWFLGAEETKTPAGANFGFRFLLAFVFGTIPAGIYAKVHYHDILANVDWLHGGAESLLTITNLIIVLGMRSALKDAEGGGPPADSSEKVKDDTTAIVSAAVLGASLSAAALFGFSDSAGAASDAADVAQALLPFARHLEPANALSIPTWAIHVSSLVEWLVAMGLIWRWAGPSGNPRWRGLTWGMLPSHTSGICACTYHLFYNAPVLNSLVALQALLTVVGNTMCAVAAWRIYSFEKEKLEGASETAASPESSSPSSSLVGFEDLAGSWEADSQVGFAGKLAVLSVGGAVLVKYGSLYIDAPFEPTVPLALGVVFGPSLLNCAKWWRRSQPAQEA